MNLTLTFDLHPSPFTIWKDKTSVSLTCLSTESELSKTWKTE